MDISLKDGKLVIHSLTEEQMYKLYNKFRRDLLDNNIIHFRPVAFVIDGAIGSSVQDNISKIPRLGYSFSELSFILDSIIISERRGILPTALNDAASLSMLRSDCSFISLNGTTIGTSEEGSMFYTGEGMTAKPRLLTKDLTLFRKLKEAVSITVVLKRGVGSLDFYDNQRLIYNTNYKPMRTNYSLYDYFKLHNYLGEGYFQLNYTEDINEDVLEQILKEYFNSEEVHRCLK